ncbi:MAG: domain containing protein [Verrucomicrobiales bacterium]|nr:domain containing protein [Verrucomicrobiales bacterium]
MRRVLTLFTVFLFTGTLVHGTTVTLPASADTWMVADFPNNNMGGAVDFGAGVNNHQNQARALLKFDVSSIPANATITSVALTLTANSDHFAADDTFVVNRLLVSWGEGTGTGNQGSPAQPNTATWTARLFNSAAWSSSGGAAPTDFNATESGSISVSGVGPFTFASTPGLVADVQNWVTTSANNNGWIFRDQNEAANAVNFVTTIRRWAARNTAGAPSLEVTYTVSAGAPNPSPVISQLIRTNNQLRFTFNAESNRTYAVEVRPNDIGTNSWSVLTNFPASLTATNFLVADPITSTNRFYRVRTP